MKSRPRSSAMRQVVRYPGVIASAWVMRAFCNCSASASPSKITALTPILPEAGNEVVAAEDSTPGILAICGISAVKKRPASSCLNCVGGSPTRNVSVFDGSTPTSVACSFRKLRNINPAPTSNTSATATSATTSPLRTRCPLPLPSPLRPPSLIASTS